MEISETGIPEDRITLLEKKVRDLDALVNGLLDELLDLKTISSTMSRQNDECGLHESILEYAEEEERSPVLAGSSISPSVAPDPDAVTVIRSRGKSQPEVPAEPAMVRIMQSDGTMKMEPRCGDQKTTDPSKENRQMKRSTALGSKRAR